MIIRNQKLGTFRRIIKGDSFRIDSITNLGGSATGRGNSGSKNGFNSFPPSRVLDFHVDVHTASQQLEFSWTAPGEDFDQGKTTNPSELLAATIFIFDQTEILGKNSCAY